MEIYVDDFDTHLLLACSSDASFRRTSFFFFDWSTLVVSVSLSPFLSHCFVFLCLAHTHTQTNNKWHYFETGTHSACHIIFISKSIILSNMMRKRHTPQNGYKRNLSWCMQEASVNTYTSKSTIEIVCSEIHFGWYERMKRCTQRITESRNRVRKPNWWYGHELIAPHNDLNGLSNIF